MDTVPNTNLLETVQFISIFSYLNALSDFLFIEKYLAEIDQNRQIPVVNALYKYLQDHHDNQTMKLKLIRRLLKGSDLYGEEENENPDEVFVNTMFDYIIKSLVFDKYGNIYGFLADVVRKTKMLQLNSLFKDIEESLKNATFENEYGESSILTSLAASRIFSDIILPLFPQPNIDLDLLSLDYIYAQAGLHFLQPGRINNTYYTDSKNVNTTVLDQENLFNEYLTIGLILDNYLANENLNLATLRAFALPALFLYVYTESVENKNITSIVFDPYYWKAAYGNLFFYLRASFNKIEETLENDTNYQIHRALSTFLTRSTVAKFYLDHHCNHLSEGERILKMNDYLNHPDSFHCGDDYIVPDFTIEFLSHVNEVSKAYKNHDLKSVKQSFGKSLLSSLKYDEVDIELLAPNNNVLFGVLNNITRIKYDLFVFHYQETEITDFYALIRENYTSTLVNQSDNHEDFQQKTGLTFKTLLNHDYHRIKLKTVNQSLDEFWNNYMSYKQLRLESYLKFVDSVTSLGEWWKEFGLSLVPFYPCLSKSIHNQQDAEINNFCEIDESTLFNLFDKNVSLLTQKNTRTLLASLGTTFKTKKLKSLINKEIYTIKELNTKGILLQPKEEFNSKIFEKLTLHIEEPGLQLSSIPKNYPGIFIAMTHILEKKINRTFTSVKNIINNITMFNFHTLRPILVVDKNINCYFYIKNQITARGNGYGYKYLYFTYNILVQLRTDYEKRKKVLLLLNEAELMESKVDDKENISFIHKQQNCTFEVTNHLHSNYEAILFLGIFVHPYDKKCDIDIYKERYIPIVECPRHARVTERKRNLNEAIKLISLKNINLTKEQILETMKNYTFPDEGMVELQFLQDWTHNKDLKIPKWTEYYKIDNHALLLKLRNEFHLDDCKISTHDGTVRISSIYTFRERQKIETRTTLETLIQNFNDQEACYVVTFEDYYAIRNFATIGYTRITGSTFEANHMKIALYKLAIRQSDDTYEFVQTLFRIEAKPVEVVDRKFSRKLHILQKFSATYLTEVSAINSATVAMPGYKNVLYEMKFTKPYFKAKIRQFHSFEENVSILLPGTMFSIVNVTETRLAELGDCLKVQLVHNHESDEKYFGYKNIMKEITRIMSKK